MNHIRTGLACCAIAAAIPTSPLAEDQGPSAEDAKLAKAAKSFADELAPSGSTSHAKLYKLAIEGALAVDTKSTKSRRSIAGRDASDGDVDADPRYLESLSSMHGASDKIWGGQRVPAGSYPDVVAVLGNRYICTGTLISSDVVLTAAHCVCDGAKDYVVFGEASRDTRGRVNVTRATTRIPCTDPLSKGDHALLFLEKPAAIPPRLLASSDQINAAKALRAVGFGRTEDPSNEPTGIKRMVDLPVASAACNGSVATGRGTMSDERYYGCGRDGELVAGLPRLDKDTCNGDSGGPVLLKGGPGRLLLAATTSRAVPRSAHDCGDGGIYARIDGKALEWMKSEGVQLAMVDTPPLQDRITTTQVRTESERRSIPVGALPVQQSAKQIGVPTGNAARLVEGARIIQRGGRAFVELRNGGALTKYAVTNVQAVSQLNSGLSGRLIVKPNDDSSVELVQFQSQALTVLGRSLAQLKANPKYAAVLRQGQEYIRATQRLGSGEAVTAQAEQNTVVQARMTEHEIVKAFLATPTSEEATRKALTTAYMQVLKHSTKKALYGRDDRFRPLTYRQIFDNSRGTAAITNRGRADYYCSGVLIGKTHLLTADHCLDDAVPGDLEVVFNYEKDLRSNPLRTDAYDVEDFVIQRQEDGFDYALLKLKPNSRGKVAGDSWRVQCLSTTRQRRDDPLYVVGHPKGEARLVADNGFVYFPFLITEVEFAKLQMLVEAELENDTDRKGKLADFRASYRKRNIDGHAMYENYSKRYQGSPILGTDTDTFHGNSGSPVYSRIEHAVVGILLAGEDDREKPWQPGWNRHEAVLVISKIIEDLDRAIPAWTGDTGACFLPPRT